MNPNQFRSALRGMLREQSKLARLAEGHMAERGALVDFLRSIYEAGHKAGRDEAVELANELANELAGARCDWCGDSLGADVRTRQVGPETLRLCSSACTVASEHLGDAIRKSAEVEYARAVADLYADEEKKEDPR